MSRPATKTDSGHSAYALQAALMLLLWKGLYRLEAILRILECPVVPHYAPIIWLAPPGNDRPAKIRDRELHSRLLLAFGGAKILHHDASRTVSSHCRNRSQRERGRPHPRNGRLHANHPRAQKHLWIWNRSRMLLGSLRTRR